MATATTSTIVGLFESRAAAEHAVDALVSEGYSRDQISVVTGDPRTSTGLDAPDIGPKDEIGTGTDAGSGALVGGLAGFIGGVVALAIPGIGPILAAGPLAAAIMGAGIGAAAGGVIGALKGHGVPENDATRFSEAIKRGRVMVTAHVTPERADHVADLLDKHGAIDVDEPADSVTGTEGGEVTPVRPLTQEAVDAVKLHEGEGVRDRQRARERRTHVYPGITGM